MRPPGQEPCARQSHRPGRKKQKPGRPANVRPAQQDHLDADHERPERAGEPPAGGGVESREQRESLERITDQRQRRERRQEQKSSHRILRNNAPFGSKSTRR